MICQSSTSLHVFFQVSVFFIGDATTCVTTWHLFRRSCQSRCLGWEWLRNLSWILFLFHLFCHNFTYIRCSERDGHFQISYKSVILLLYFHLNQSSKFQIPNFFIDFYSFQKKILPLQICTWTANSSFTVKSLVSSVNEGIHAVCELHPTLMRSECAWKCKLT